MEGRGWAHGPLFSEFHLSSASPLMVLPRRIWGCRPPAPTSFASRIPWEADDHRSCCWNLLAALQRPGEAGWPEFMLPTTAGSELRAPDGGLCSLLGAPTNPAWPPKPYPEPLRCPWRGRDRVEGDFSAGIVTFSFKDSGNPVPAPALCPIHPSMS